MAGNDIYRGPAIKPIDDEPFNNLVRTIGELVEKGDLDPAKFNIVLEQVRDARLHALAVVDDGDDDEMAEIRKDPELLHKAKLDELVEIMEGRFRENGHRHDGLDWDLIYRKIRSATKTKVTALMRMESTLGKPDVLRYDRKKDRVMFFDFADESPRLRRDLTYFGAWRKAWNMGVSIATWDIYKEAYGLSPMDKHSENWIKSSFLDFLDGTAKVVQASPYDDSRYLEFIRKTDHNPKRGFRSYLVI